MRHANPILRSASHPFAGRVKYSFFLQVGIAQQMQCFLREAVFPISFRLNPAGYDQSVTLSFFFFWTVTLSNYLNLAHSPARIIFPFQTIIRPVKLMHISWSWTNGQKWTRPSDYLNACWKCNWNTIPQRCMEETLENLKKSDQIVTNYLNPNHCS
jgi:hypothetical protein